MQPAATYREYIILCLCLCLGSLSTALASPLYPIYMQAWHISNAQIGYAFIAYMFGVVFSLLFLNGLTAKQGYKRIVITGLIISIASMLYSAFAPNIWHLCSARFLIGISSGLLTTATVIGLNQKYPFANKQHAGKASSMLTVFGFGLGPLLGGLIADHSAAPLHTPYLVIAAVSLAVLCACPLIQYAHQPVHKSKASLWNTPSSLFNKTIFYPCALTAIGCFGIFSLYAALAGTFLSHLPLPKSATLTGLSISVILFISTLTQLSAKSLKESTSLSIGLALSALGCISLMMAQYTQQTFWLMFSILSVGIGHGLSLSPCYSLVGRISQKENPAIFSTFLLLGYQGAIWPVLLSSILIDHFGIMVSLMVFSALIMLICGWVYLHIRPIAQRQQTANC